MTMIIIAVLIAVSLPIAFDNIGITKGWIWTPYGWEHPDPDNSPAFPESSAVYCCCSHTDIIWTGGPFDCWTSIAVTATYDQWTPPYNENNGFKYASWSYHAASGGVNPQYTYIPFACSLGADNNWATNYCYDTPVYQYHDPFEGYMVFWSYDNNPNNPFDPTVNTITGSADAYFINGWDDIFLVEATVIPWNLITAH